MRWTIVTSGNFIWQSFCVIFIPRKASNKSTPRALERAGIPTPAAGIVTANDVSQGKPHPDPYLAGAALCSADPLKCWYYLRSLYSTYLELRSCCGRRDFRINRWPCSRCPNLGRLHIDGKDPTD